MDCLALGPHRAVCFCLVSLLWIAWPASAQVNPDQAADLLLNSARKAYAEENYPFAAARFREFLQKFGGHANANQARYGLGLSLLDGPERNFEQAIEPLAQLASQPQFPDYPYVLYHLGLAHRGAGLNDLAQATAKPAEAQQHRARAEGRFNEAARQFAAAAAAFAAKSGKVEPDVKELPPELDWLARARCDQAEMELRLGRVKEARVTAEPFVKDPLLTRSRHGQLGLYYHGFASFLLGDYLVAGRSLNQTAPFTDPVYGTHARYLLGRVYQLSNEQAEAAAAFEGVLADFDKQRADAAEALKRPELLRNSPWERQRLEMLLKKPPEHVGGAVFYLACLQCEAGKFAEALGRFQQFAKDHPQSPLVPDAALRIGYCQVQLKLFDEAMKTLQALANSQPRLADQALLWLGKAQTSFALALEPEKTQERASRLSTALATLRSAVDRAHQLSANDPDARQRRGEILLELSDTQQAAKQAREAVATIEQILNEGLLPNRAEELAQRLAAALHLAGDFARSDQVCAKFERDFPKSTLLAAVRFRAAENAYFIALTADKSPNPPNRAELARLYGEAARRYQALIEKYPEFERIQLARYGLAMTHLLRSEFDKAQEVLETIPAADRVGELAAAPYLLAECLLRQVPERDDDALAAGIKLEKLSKAQQYLEGFIAASPKAPELPDALLKLGYCLQRLALLNAQPQERQTGLQNARQVYEKLAAQFPGEPQAAQAALERAKCLAYTNDKQAALDQLLRFTTDAKLQQSAVAPLAILNLATLLRELNRAEEAAHKLAAARQRYEPGLARDPERVALLRYHHGICLQEAGKFAEARQQLESVQHVLQNHPLTAEAALRSWQCRLQEGGRTVEAARQQLANSSLTPQQHSLASAQLQSGLGVLNEAGQNLERRADELRQNLPGAEVCARMYYDAAWAYRTVGEHEHARARAEKQRETQRKLQEEANRRTPAGTKPPTVPVPEVARTQVPLQPAEERARSAYQNLIGGFADLELAVEARFELAELLAERDEHGPATKLLREALDKEPADKSPPADLLDKVRLRLGACLVASREYEAALGQFEAVAGNPKSPLVVQAQLRAGECLLEAGATAKAIERLRAFRDKPEFVNVPGCSDRALLRLGHAYAQTKQWGQSKEVLEMLAGRFGGSPWVNEARYGIGWALQNLGQHEAAVNAYNQVIANTILELAAKAHLQIGLCRMEQKRWGDAVAALLVVPFTYDYPDLSAVALCEAGRALVEDKKPEQAERLWRRLLKDYPQSDWAKVAQERLDKLAGSP